MWYQKAVQAHKDGWSIDGDNRSCDDEDNEWDLRWETDGLLRAESRPPGKAPPGTKVFFTGNGTSRAAGSGEVKTWRGGDIVEAGAVAILNNLGQSSLLIYPTELEEWYSSQLLALWVAEWWVHRRAELVAGIHQVGVAFSVIAGKISKSHFVYKVNGHAKFVWRQR